ncbi:histidine phosphatase family protein [Micrococcus porci]|uniref:histidine phosphatase family protein n=1 Tax=Micrococcus porci TaxID=2856555 RepID=UPI001CC9E472|nr:histidine phosphatase family protein [Micrococcus porci]UBH24038.1 histidine phosphatase family protein [Micrococcus porci]
MRLVLLRHGETDWNALDRYQGRTDVPLNALGERQAAAAAAGPVGELLRSAEDLVAVSSPLIRARRTAEIVLEDAVGAVELAVDSRLVELGGGEWEGLDFTEIGARWPHEHHAWRTVPDLDGGPVGGEVLRAGGERVLAAAAAHVPEDWSTPRPARVPDARTLLIVAHGAVIRAAAGLALALEGADFAHLARVSNARAVILDGTFAGEGPGAWSLLGYDV